MLVKDVKQWELPRPAFKNGKVNDPLWIMVWHMDYV